MMNTPAGKRWSAPCGDRDGPHLVGIQMSSPHGDTDVLDPGRTEMAGPVLSCTLPR